MKKSAKLPARRETSTSIEEWSLDHAIVVKELANTAQPEYVAWIDLMGAKGWMAGSIRRAAGIIGMIHIAGTRAAREHNIKAYPVIDGIYLSAKDKNKFRLATDSAMRTLAVTFLAQDKPDRRFLVRGGIAYGRVLHGEDIAELHIDLQKDKSYSSCLAVGIAIGQAYAAESKAPPFGYYVDTTARSTAPVKSSPYISSFYRWWPIKTEAQAACKFGQALDEHFKYLCSRRRELEYPEERLKEHREIAREYFKLTADQVTLRKGVTLDI